MNPNTLAEDQGSTLLTVDANPVRLSVPVGSAIFAYTGEIWITQEGMYEDVILGPGERFIVRSRGPILASATKGTSATVYVACAPEATRHVDTDVHALLRQRALRLRTAEINAIGKTISDRLSRGLAGVFAQLRVTFAASKTPPLTHAPR